MKGNQNVIKVFVGDGDFDTRFTFWRPPQSLAALPRPVSDSGTSG